MKVVCLKFDKFPVLESMHDKFALHEKEVYTLVFNMKKLWTMRCLKNQKCSQINLMHFVSMNIQKRFLMFSLKLHQKL